MFGNRNRMAHQRVRGTAFAAIVATGALVLTGCGNIAEKAAEKATEKLIESASGIEDVDIDAKTGEVTVRDSDGATHTYSGEEDGTFTYSSGDDVEYKVGGGETSAPDWFPSDVHLPSSFTVATSARDGSGDSTSYILGLQVETSVADAFDDFTNDMTSKGWEVTMENKSDSQGYSQYMTSIEKGENSIMFSATNYGDDQGTVLQYIWSGEIG